MQKMLLLSITLIISLLCTQTLAQDSFRTGLSYVRFGVDKQTGIGYFNEYEHSFNHRLALASSLQLAYGTKPGDFPFYLINKFAIGADINLFLSLLRSSKVELRVGAGPSFRYISGHNLDKFVVSDGAAIGGLGPDGTYSVPFFYPKERLSGINHLAAGYSLALGSEFSVSSHWLLGIRITSQGYSSKDKITNAGFTVGYRL